MLVEMGFERILQIQFLKGNLNKIQYFNSSLSIKFGSLIEKVCQIWLSDLSSMIVLTRNPETFDYPGLTYSLKKTKFCNFSTNRAW